MIPGIEPVKLSKWYMLKLRVKWFFQNIRKSLFYIHVKKVIIGDGDKILIVIKTIHRDTLTYDHVKYMENELSEFFGSRAFVFLTDKDDEVDIHVIKKQKENKSL